MVYVGFILVLYCFFLGLHGFYIGLYWFISVYMGLYWFMLFHVGWLIVIYDGQRVNNSCVTCCFDFDVIDFCFFGRGGDGRLTFPQINIK